jgi:hypothetical protein
MRALVLAFASFGATGCYLSHQAEDEEAGLACVQVGDPRRFSVVVLETEEGCGPISAPEMNIERTYGSCTGGIEPAPDRCSARVDWTCDGVESHQEVHGTLTGRPESGDIEQVMQAHSWHPCRWTERWIAIE